MGLMAVSGAMILCTMGMAPGTLMAAVQSTCLAGGKPVAGINDIAPMTSVGACGMCTSMMNPAVSAATAAALGVLTPQPCVPVPMGPWKPGGAVIIGGAPCLSSDSMLNCAYGGVISIANPGQTQVMI